jgi:hypothetical protein
MTVRDELVSFLQGELVGPRPGLPMVQLDDEEILSPQDPPRLRYGAGILFPSARPLDEQEDDGEAVGNTGEVEVGPDRSAASDEATGETDPRADERGDSRADTDYELNRTNESLPSALGITVLVRLPAQLSITIFAAQYERVGVPGAGYMNRQNEWVPTPYWFRRKLDQTLYVDCSRLLDDRQPVFEIPIPGRNAGTLLALHMYSRSARPSLPGAGDRDRFITFSLINRTPGAKRASDEYCFFQCGLSVEATDNEPCFLEYPEKPLDGSESDEELGLLLLYRHRKIFAVGHGCSAEWTEQNGVASQVRSTALPVYEVAPILPAMFEGLEFRMQLLGKENNEETIELCQRLADGYEEWIEQQGASAERFETEAPHLRQAASSNLADCTRCLTRIRAGIELLRINRQARRAFALMNRAMLMQHAHYDLATNHKRLWRKSANGLQLASRYIPPDYQASVRSWRPFQIAFVLMSLRSIVLDDPSDLDERAAVDLIWFPTGGGKTEAYLGLAAFTIFWRRLANPDNAGTTALMRYTLRLLTTQQYQRAASLICACEKIRRESPADLGPVPISIGLWVGGDVTPNTEKQAERALEELLRGERENPFIILSCPWCGAQMGPVREGTKTRAKGYRKLTKPNRVRLICEDGDCDFNSGEGLPLRIIDEDIYSNPPTLVIGTVDKFALLPWNPKARSLFGLTSENIDPPDLIIQDELHLISGPLGSMVGHYETVIDALTRQKTRGQTRYAKIVASTATIARAQQQISALYGGRRSYLFPPQGLRAGDSYFAEERADLPGRAYAGVFASGLPSQTTTEVRVLSAILQAPLAIEDCTPEQLDPYWTAMVYFNSIRELGHAATLLKADIPEYMSVMWRRLGFETAWGDAAAKRRRFINADMELTSRVQNSEITEYMEKLFAKYPRQGDAVPVDVCLATNMIQVGLDVQRLSLMAIIGQPKTTSEYIQASSRVGRSEEGPGLVITILSPAKPRDRSHFEHFRAFHQSIYRYVEPTSVTPFAVPVTERVLHALVAILARFWGSEIQREFPHVPDADLETRIRQEILNRVGMVEPDEGDRVAALLDRIFKEWQRLPPDVYGSFHTPADTVPFMYPSGNHPSEQWDGRAYATPSSMRNVDAGCQAKVIALYPDNTG